MRPHRIHVRNLSDLVNISQPTMPDNCIYDQRERFCARKRIIYTVEEIFFESSLRVFFFVLWRATMFIRSVPQLVFRILSAASIDATTIRSGMYVYATRV